MFKPTEAGERNLADFGWFVLGSMNNRTEPMKEQTNMNKQRIAVNHDLSMLAEDARALMAATADLGGEKVAEARKRVAAALESGKEVYGRVREKAIDRARAADQGLRANPYETIGVAFGVGALIGFLFGRK